MERHWQKALCIALAAAVGPGCSLFWTRRPPSDAVPPEDLRCTSSVAAPVLDTVAVGAVLAGTALAGALILSGSYPPDPCPQGAGFAGFGCELSYQLNRDLDRQGRAVATVLVAAAGLGAAVVYVMSARQGFGDAARCRELEAWRDRAGADPTLPWPPAAPPRDAAEPPAPAPDPDYLPPGW